jgi:hypothetical protein
MMKYLNRKKFSDFEPILYCSHKHTAKTTLLPGYQFDSFYGGSNNSSTIPNLIHSTIHYLLNFFKYYLINNLPVSLVRYSLQTNSHHLIRCF